MKIIPSLRILLLAVAVLALSACREDADTAPAETAPVPAPAPGADQMAWRAYLTDVVRRHAPDDVAQTYNYFLPASGADDYEQTYGRQLENVENALARTVPPGNMLIFSSPEPARAADLLVSAFETAGAGSLPGVYVLLIGRNEDEARAREAVAPSGAQFIFVEMR